MIDLKIISGTDRPNSNALRVSKYIQSKYQDRDIPADIINLQEFPLEKVTGGRYGDDLPKVDNFILPAVEADGLIIVCPEYNGGYPGILKMFIDYFPFPGSLDDMPVALVGEATGAFGAMRAVEQLQQVLLYRNAYLYSVQVYITRIHENFDGEDGIADPLQQQLLETQISDFPDFVNKLKN